MPKGATPDFAENRKRDSPNADGFKDSICDFFPPRIGYYVFCDAKRFAEAQSVFPEKEFAMTWSSEFEKTQMLGLLKYAWKNQISDIHLRQGEPVVLRDDGRLIPQSTILDYPEIRAFIDPLLTSEQTALFDETHELDFSCEVPDLCRLRINIFIQRTKLCVAIRLLPKKVPSMEELYLPKACTDFCSLQKGLVLVTGPTGSGKSTTLAAMLDHINTHRANHILTIEDPIEFIYENKQSMVSQREIGSDSYSFAAALKHALRQDPDVVLLGEMRDLETMQAAITMAETGHLTFSTLHTGEAWQTISRVVDSFPPHQQDMVRMQMAGSLAGIVSQQLLPLKDQKGRVAAREGLVNTRGVANLISENKLEQITTAIQTGGNDKMFTMNYSLGHLFQNGFITYEVAYNASFDRKDFKQKYGKDKD
jgi:twitching motility protein PilT